MPEHALRDKGEVFCSSKYLRIATTAFTALVVVVDHEDVGKQAAASRVVQKIQTL